jgi:hypothetical protein
VSIQRSAQAATGVLGKIAAFNNAERRIADTDKIANTLLDRGPLDVAAGMTAHLARPLRLKGNQHPHVRTLSEPTSCSTSPGIRRIGTRKPG